MLIVLILTIMLQTKEGCFIQRTVKYQGLRRDDKTPDTDRSSYCFNSSSRSSTDFSSFIRIVVREGNWAVGVLCAVTRAGLNNR